MNMQTSRGERSEVDEKGRRGNLGRDALIIVGLLAVVGVAYSIANLVGQKSRVLSHDIVRIVMIGNQLMDTGRFEEAIAHYDRALAADSTLVDVMVDRGSCYFALDRYEEAVSDFMTALSVVPDHATAQFNLGIAYSALGRDSLAVACWVRCLDLQPEGYLADRARELLEKHGKRENEGANDQL